LLEPEGLGGQICRDWAEAEESQVVLGTHGNTSNTDNTSKRDGTWCMAVGTWGSGRGEQRDPAVVAECP
jgi:hypothetical protein